MIDHDDPELTADSNELQDPGQTEPESRASVRNIAILAGLAVLMLLGGGWYVSWAGNRVSDDLVERELRAQAAIREFEANQPPPELAASDTAQPPSGPVPQPGEVLVVNRTPGDDYGRLAIRHQDGSRTLLDRDCIRVHIAADRGVCLSQGNGVVPSFTTSFFDPAAPLTTIKSYASALPSRARISPDGRFSSVTAFISGASYEDIGGEAATIVTIDDIDGEGGNTLSSLSRYDIDSDDATYGDSIDAQYWGMTFADSDRFYVTGFFDETAEILLGSVDDQTLTPTGWEGSCPSLSPDGKTLVFKEERPEGGFSLVAVDVETERRWTLNESKSVDDQVEWLDNDTILSGVHPDGADDSVQPEFDIWMIDIDEDAEPELFLPNADSPAVAR